MERGLDLRRLHVFLQSSLLLLLLCPARFTITAGSSTDQPCNVQPIHKCLINTYDMENNPTSTSAPLIVTCPEYDDGDQDFYLASGDSCCPQNEVTAVVNLTRGIRKEIECSLEAPNLGSTTNPVIYEWKMQAPNMPKGYRIILTLVTRDVYNNFTATDGEGCSEFTFSTRSFFEVGDYFLSSSNVVHMKASLESLDSTSQQFTVIGQVVNIINTFNITDDPHGCTDNGRNLWDTETGCSDDSHRFEGSCYYFYSEGTNLNEARQMCEARTEGSHLVFIDNKEEQDFLASTSDDINQDCSHVHDCDYLIGIERNNDGELTWMDGSHIIYEHFKSSDDDGKCFRLKSEDKYVWESHNCNQMHYGYICEKENGYHGTNRSDMGCITYKARPAVSRTVLTDTNNDILLMFRYYIKTFEESAGNNKSVNLWTGNKIVSCKSSNVETLHHAIGTSLKINISCSVSSDQLMEKFKRSSTSQRLQWNFAKPYIRK